MKATVITKRFVMCPGCGDHEHSVEHLIVDQDRERDRVTGREVGPWTCDVTTCRTRVWMRVSPDGAVDITKTEVGEANGYALVKLRDLYIVLREPYGRIEADHADYFYHSHQCPTNLLRHLVAVYSPSGDPDQHGMIRFVANIEDTEEARDKLDPEVGPGVELREVFDLFKTDGEPIADSEYPEENEGVIAWLAELQREHREKTS